MSKFFERETRYIVFKVSDLRDHAEIEKQRGAGFSGALPGHSKPAIQRMLEELATRIRNELGKSDLKCVVIESDWPEYETTWSSISARVAIDE